MRFLYFTGGRRLQNRGQRGRKQRAENREQNRARAALVMRLQSHLNSVMVQSP